MEPDIDVRGLTKGPSPERLEWLEDESGGDVVCLAEGPGRDVPARAEREVVFCSRSTADCGTERAEVPPDTTPANVVPGRRNVAETWRLASGKLRRCEA